MQVIEIPVKINPDDLKVISAPQNPFSKWEQRFKDLTNEGLKVDAEELFAYAVFVEWADSLGWNTYKDLARKIPNRRERFEEYLHAANDNNIRLTRPPTRDVCEAIGVGATLALTSRILGLTNADFRKIPETSKHKTHDYEYPLRASNGSELIRVEAKGTHDGKSVSVQRASIKEKKAERLKASQKESYREALLGVICDLQYKRPRTPTRLLVYDPPADISTLDPAFVQLVNRLSYYSSEIARISRGQLAVALSNRTRDVEALESDWRSLDGLPLLSSRGKPLAVYETMGDWVRSIRGPVFNGRLYDLRLTREALRGTLASVRERPPQLYFRGLIHQSLALLANQDFDSLLRIRFKQRTFRIRGRYNGELHLLPSGLTVGILKPGWYSWNEKRLPDIWRQLTVKRDALKKIRNSSEGT